MRKTEILAWKEKRYGKEGVGYKHTYLKHAFGIYYDKAWCSNATFKSLYPKSKYIIKWKK